MIFFFVIFSFFEGFPCKASGTLMSTTADGLGGHGDGAPPVYGLAALVRRPTGQVERDILAVSCQPTLPCIALRAFTVFFTE